MARLGEGVLTTADWTDGFLGVGTQFGVAVGALSELPKGLAVVELPFALVVGQVGGGDG